MGKHISMETCTFTTLLTTFIVAAELWNFKV